MSRQRSARRPRRTPDPARRLAFDVLRQVNGEGAYANLALNQALAQRSLEGRDAAFATELVSGTARQQGGYDRIIEAAGGRSLGSLQPAVVDLLRLGTHQILALRTPTQVAVAATVNLTALTVGERATGVVNAILRKVAARDLEGWLTQLAADSPDDALAIETMHPAWIADEYVHLLGDAEGREALAANNVAAAPTLVVRPGLAEVSELLDAGATPLRFSPLGASYDGNPGQVRAVREGRAGVQDEGSQLAALALSRVPVSDALASEPWLDLCAGPGGKAALLAGLAAAENAWLLASELQEHRAHLVAQALAAYRPGTTQVIAADGTTPAWAPHRFARVMADVPCTGLGALRRRPESRWRRTPDDVDELHQLQVSLLQTALMSAAPGGVVAYVTCSPHHRETVDVVAEALDGTAHELLDAPALLPEVPDAGLGRCVQLWPHRHGTDAMFIALIRVADAPIG